MAHETGPRPMDPERGSSRELETLIRIGNAVEGTFREVRRSPRRAREVGMGASDNPTAEIDRAAEARVLACLEHEGVRWNLLSEELGFVDRGGDDTLVVDPVDGSHNALSEIPCATISLALGRERLSDLRVGVVHDLFLGRTHWAIQGRGAYVDGVRMATRPWRPGQELLMVNLGANATPRAHGAAASVRRVRALGCASLEMALVAQGASDGYFSDNDPAERNLRVTDIAAGYLLVREAGGGVHVPGSGPLDLPLDLKDRTPLLAWGDVGFLEQGRQEGRW
jgi:fructose-1,6-bisphosphatase/inositol monophosphatase family enzyme